MTHHQFDSDCNCDACTYEDVLGERIPCPHGCTDHTILASRPTSCGHYHSPSEWGHREQLHNSAYWKAIGEQADKSHESKIGLRAEEEA